MSQNPAHPIRVLLIAPSPEQGGGQAGQPGRLLATLRTGPSVAAGFLPIDGWSSRKLARVPYLRTLVNGVGYLFRLVVRMPRYDIVHVFSAGLWSYTLWTMPAL